MNEPDLLTTFEPCNRAGYWARDWERLRLTSKEFLEQGVRHGLTVDRPDFGNAAGEFVIELGSDHELLSQSTDVYSSIVHLATLSDLISTAVRKPQEAPWLPAEPVDLPDGRPWRSDALLDLSGARLRRVLFVSSWNDDRHYSVCRGWGSLGTVCAYGLPLQIAVVITGSFRDGKYSSPWTQGYRHPSNRGLRFRKKKDAESGFKESWLRIWREDFDDIPTDVWLQTMLSDGVLKDCCFSIELPVPEKAARQEILDLAVRKLDRLEKLTKLPDRNLSTCDFPVPCQFRNNCHSGNEPSGRYGFVRIDL